MADSPIACATCGTQLENPDKRQRYCNISCRNKRQRRSRSRPERILSRTYECWWCGIDYHPKRTEQNKCCSRTCGDQWRIFAQKARAGHFTTRHSITRFKCLSCNKWHVGIATQRYCSDECRKAMAAIKHRSSAEASHVAQSYSCRECGIWFTPAYGTKRRKFCSDKCSRRNYRRTSRKRERALLRQVQVEPVNPIKVFERDGWRCCQCGTRTPRRLRGTYDDRAPEMDHIEPLSQGGEHSYRNTQCLCRKCNAAKSDGAGGQLRLFG
jgi:hypothetical protein